MSLRAAATNATRAPGRDKRRFAKPVFDFAKQALPGFPMLWLMSGCAIFAMTIFGAFGTGQMPVGPRAAFWSLLLGWSALKWQAWFALTVRTPRDWRRACLVGMVVLNLLIPLEVKLSLLVLGHRSDMPFTQTWLSALVISVILLVLIASVVRRLRAPPAAATIMPPANGPVARAGIDPALLIAVEAEDHYCRLHAAGTSRLVHGRFSDALAEIDSVPGARIHRGLWVAQAAIVGTNRVGRRWSIRLSNGSERLVSVRYVGELRKRGWLRR
jgi:hypothetical protein